MKIPIILIVLAVTLTFLPSMVNGQRSNTSVAAVRAALASQVSSWNAGDLDKAMGFYWNSPDMLWISRRGIDKGYQSVLDGYRKDFTDRSLMGTYSYEMLHIERISGSAVYVVIRWKIEAKGKKTMGGVSSQLWKRVKDRWVVVSEHAG